MIIDINEVGQKTSEIMTSSIPYKVYDVIIEDWILGQIFLLGRGSGHYTQKQDWVKESLNLVL